MMFRLSTLVALLSLSSCIDIVSAASSSSTSSKKTTTSSSSSTSKRTTSSTSTSIRSTKSSSTSGTCPPYKTTTRTRTSTTYIDNPTVSPRSSLTWTSYLSTTTSVLLTDWTSYNFVYTSSTTSTVPTTTTTIKVIPATKTVTVPTAAGFTPVLCLPNYLDPTSTVIKTVLTEPTFFTSVTSPVSTATEYSYTSTSTFQGTYDFAETIYEFPTSTVTSTRANPTSSVYAACATNNLTPYGPNGTYIRTRLTTYGGVYQVNVPAVDLTDCCAGCQANSSCTAMTAYPAGRFGPDLSCYWYIKSSESNPKCDGSFKSLKITPIAAEEPIIYVANSQCGQVTTD